MAKLRKGVSYRTIERPNTRISKFKGKSFVRMTPNIKISRFEMGENRKYKYVLNLIPKASVQIRQESLESARQTSLRHLEGNLGKLGYYFRLKVFPFHVLRENPLASGAGADRMSTGMQKSFGKPIGVAAQVRKGRAVMDIGVDRDNIPVAKEALRKALTKMSCSFSVQVVENK
ncbi:50S ribosomal protein L16 [Candidatus Woesearchaeota archaeon]|nr:50S ribosomal protein L16 [Candidatus Woesearchaeota archaeon]